MDFRIDAHTCASKWSLTQSSFKSITFLPLPCSTSPMTDFRLSSGITYLANKSVTSVNTRIINRKPIYWELIYTICSYAKACTKHMLWSSLWNNTAVCVKKYFVQASEYYVIASKTLECVHSALIYDSSPCSCKPSKPRFNSKHTFILLNLGFVVHATIYMNVCVHFKYKSRL